MTELDAYIAEEQKKGVNSVTMNALCAHTLKNSPYTQIISSGKGGLAGFRFPEEFVCVVHSAGADPFEKNLSDYAVSLVDRLVLQAHRIGALPIAFADVIDGSSSDRLDLRALAEPLLNRVDELHLVVPNGESAWLGSRVTTSANLSGTMISLMPKKNIVNNVIIHDGVWYGLFEHEGKLVVINSDGVGTKTEFYERAKKYELAFLDFLAMTLDDTSKSGAVAKVVSGVLETRMNIPVHKIQMAAHNYARQLGLVGILQPEVLGARIMGYNPRVPSYNISGSVVSVIDEERLKNPPAPQAGDLLIAIRGKPTPRSNGITDKRKAMIAMLGNDWHNTEKGKYFMEFLAEPSTVFYPLFDALLSKGLASSVYHMSGGAYKGKLAAPLAKHNLFVRVRDLFPVDPREKELAGSTPNETAYAKWPMGNEGFVTSSKPQEAIDFIKAFGLDASDAGHVKSAKKEKTGVELLGIYGSDGKPVYFSGRD